MNKRVYLSIIIIFLVAFFIRLFPIRLGHWWDETVYLQNAEFLMGRKNYEEFSFRPPLLSIIFYFVFFIWHSPIAASIITAFISTLAPLFTFLIGKKIYDVKTGALAGILTGFTPFVFLNSNFIMTDVPAVSLMAISFYLALFKKNNYLFLSGIFFSLAVLMKFTSLLLFPVILVYLFIERYSQKNKMIWFLGSALILLPYFIWAYISFGNPFSPLILGSRMVSDKNEATLFYFWNFNKVFTILAPLGLIISIASLRLYKKTGFIMFLWILIFLLYLSYVPHKELRYLLPIMVPVSILASRGFAFLAQGIKYEWIIYSAIFVYLFWLAFTSLDLRLIDRGVTDEMKASHFIANEINYSGLVYSNHNWPVFAYYSHARVKVIWPQDTSFYQTFPENMGEGGLVVITDGINKHPNKEWLESRSEFTFLGEFGNVGIYDYENEVYKTLN